MFNLSWLWSSSSSDEESSDTALNAASPTSPDSESEQGSKTSNNGNTWVYVWSLTSETVGHVAIQVGGDKPKKQESDAGEYYSHHPSSIPAIGPTTVLPLPATTAKTLTEDEITEGSASRESIVTDCSATNTTIASEPTRRTAPDKVYLIKKLDQAAMVKEIDTMREDTEEGKHAYQLLPNVNVFKVLQDAPHFLNQDPIDVLVAARNQALSNQSTPYKADNCATAVAKIINVGGGEISVSKTPWGITPNDLAQQLEEQYPQQPNKPSV